MSDPRTIALAPTGDRVSDALSRAVNVSTTGDREAAFPAPVSVWCLRLFVPAAAAGSVIAMVAPVAFVRVLGLVALVASVAMVTLHVYLLQRDHPAEWIALRNTAPAWFQKLRLRWSSLVARSTGSSIPAPAAPFKPRLVAAATEKEF